MEETGINLFSKKNIITFLLIGIMLAAIPVAVRLVQEQQQLESKAGGGANVSFVTSSTLKQDSSGNFTTTSPDINVRVASPFVTGQ
ncbi:MAG: hypothetical protein Q7R49_02095 [Candidatus Daviesbacteria bacterium]|nr:hypothetical protein [Candidatus Daviesbacteria bacterium]